MTEPPQFMKRRKRIVIPMSRILKLLVNQRVTQTYVTVPEISGLPESAFVLGVSFEAARASYVFHICDESFEEIEDGVEAPELHVHWNTVEIARPEGREKP